MLVLDINVVSKLMRPEPDVGVLAWAGRQTLDALPIRAERTISASAAAPKSAASPESRLSWLGAAGRGELVQPPAHGRDQGLCGGKRRLPVGRFGGSGSDEPEERPPRPLG